MNDNNHASTDYETIRDNLYAMLKDALEALEFAKDILKDTEHPRAVEVYSGLLNNVVKLNTQILELSKIHKDITERKTFRDSNTLSSPDSETSPTQVYIGTTADLQKMLKNANENNLIDVTPDV